MYKMLFNTGVKPENSPFTMPFEVWKGGVKHVEYFIATPPPEGARILWLCDSPDVRPGQVAIEIVDGGMISKYAVFALKGV